MKTATQVAATVAVCQGLCLAHRAGRKRRGGLPRTIPTRTLGKTGLKLPILGYGGAALPELGRIPFRSRIASQLVRYAYNRGIRYYDTSVYMESEAILGEASPGPSPRRAPGDEGREHPAGRRAEVGRAVAQDTANRLPG